MYLPINYQFRFCKSAAKINFYFERTKKIGEKVLEKVTVKGVVCVEKGKWIRKTTSFYWRFFLSSSVPQFLSFVLGGILDGYKL